VLGYNLPICDVSALKIGWGKNRLGIQTDLHFFKNSPLTKRSGLVKLYKKIIPMYITNMAEVKAHLSAFIEKVLAG